MRRAALSLLSTLTFACGAHDPGPVQSKSAAADPPADPRVELDRLIGEYFYTPAGAERDALERRIDELAGQRYALWSRLYWHRDLDAARAEARATGKPILSLRMLGSLDRDLSCANSRFFRVALYANRDVSSYLRDHFVLHWSSERPVPVARIDFGDGRVLERTIAGNSAHYVLDGEGRPVDVLPGLYSPALFVESLKAVEPTAIRAGALDDAAYRVEVATFHQGAAEKAQARFATLGSVQPAGGSLVEAEGRAMSKAAVEIPVVRSLELGSQLALEEVQRYRQQDALWAQVGALLSAAVGPATLDVQSRALFAHLRPVDWERAGQPLPEAGIDRLVSAFEAVMGRDSAYNELVLHQQIHARFIAQGEAVDFAALNRWVYATLFLTPAEDPWLGMATPDIFTGLPGDGVVANRAP